MSIDARFLVRHGSFVMDVDLSLPAAGVTGLFGPSGCGKTTFLRAVAGLDHVPGGRLRIGGEVWQDENGTFVPVHHRSVGYIFQEPSLFEHLDVHRNIEYGLKRARPADDGAGPYLFDHLVKMTGLEQLLNRRPSTLSGGERQRVAIARALGANPRLLLMDEPLSSLDERSKEDIIPHLDALRRELRIPLIYVSHSLDELARLGDHLVILEDGTVVGQGPIGEVMTRLDLPLSRAKTAESLLSATVAAHDEEFELTTVEFDGGQFLVEHLDVEPGTRVRLRILARDVSLALERTEGTSILNVFPVSVDEVDSDGPAHAVVRLKVGSAPLLARITRKSRDRLDVRPGRRLFAQVKSVAIVI